MKAIVSRIYGSPDVMKLEEVPTPMPGEGEVLVKIHRSSVNAADWHLLRADPFFMRFMAGLFKPKKTILGADMAGVVEAAASNVTRFQVGDEVFGEISGCPQGSFAEYVSVPEAIITHKPSAVSFDQAAAVPLAAMTALQGLRNKGQIQSGQKVLINGASGGVGSFAVQIAKALGAQVTAVCSARNVEMAESLGADRVIDYAKEDFTRREERYDLVFIANGNGSILDYARTLERGGTLVIGGGSMSQFYRSLYQMPLVSMTQGKRAVSYVAQPNLPDLEFVAELLASGKVTPVIDRTYPLAGVPEAVRYLEAGHAPGKVVIAVG